MSRTPELHERFAGWLTARASGDDDDPPRDLALHAADASAASNPPTRSTRSTASTSAWPRRRPFEPTPVRRGSVAWVQVGRYAVAVAALVLVAGSVALGSSWLGDRRSTDSGELRATPPEGVLAGVPSPTVGSRLSATLVAEAVRAISPIRRAKRGASR